jgi:excisionase family DNA binding protein
MDTDPTSLNDARQTRIPLGGPSLLPPTLPPARAGRLLGIGRRQTYEGIRRGDIRAIRIGRRLLVPTSWLLDQLGLPAEQLISVEDQPPS